MSIVFLGVPRTSCKSLGFCWGKAQPACPVFLYLKANTRMKWLQEVGFSTHIEEVTLQFLINWLEMVSLQVSVSSESTTLNPSVPQKFSWRITVSKNTRKKITVCQTVPSSPYICVCVHTSILLIFVREGSETFYCNTSNCQPNKYRKFKKKHYGILR